MQLASVVRPESSIKGDKALDVAHEFYRQALATLAHLRIPFLIGGAFALRRYGGIDRWTRDLDVFVQPEDAWRALEGMSAEGFQTEHTFTHWLGKIRSGENYVDVIFSSGNGVARVDAGWFEHAVPDRVLGLEVRLCPPEETIWSKAFVMERERFDGADVNHILRARGHELDWHRLLARFGPHRRLLLAHVLMFDFVYPGEHERVPDWVRRQLLEEASLLPEPPDDERLCRGPLLSRSQYLRDLEWGYVDARLAPHGDMSPEEIRVWTEAAEQD